jgi:secreted trypsin-like serine protease
MMLFACEAEDAALLQAVDEGFPSAEAAMDVSGLEIDEQIFFGTTASLQRHKGVVSIIDANGFPFCSGTLVRANRVLTAAHCVDGTGVAFIGIGTDMFAGGVTTVAVSQVSIHPTWDPNTLRGDLAMLTLSRNVTNATPLTPATSLHPLRAADVGRTGEAVGYGDDENGNFGRRERADVPIVQLDPAFVYTDSSRSGVCFGDSGGPLLVRIDGILRIAGVASFVIPGAQDCTGFAGYSRLDAFTPWLSTF